MDDAGEHVLEPGRGARWPAGDLGLVAEDVAVGERREGRGGGGGGSGSGPGSVGRGGREDSVVRAEEDGAEKGGVGGGVLLLRCFGVRAAVVGIGRRGGKRRGSNVGGVREIEE